ncbi:hypothetical protein ABZP36_013732 [Zizania latifolia]
MSGASHDHLQLGGEFPFNDELASLFAQRSDATPGLQQPWSSFLSEYHHHLKASAATAPLDYEIEAFAGEFDDVPVPVAAPLEEVKRELAVDDTASLELPGGSIGATVSGPMTPNSMSMSSTSSEACGAGAGGDEESAGKCKKEEGDGDEGKGLSTKGDGEGEDKNKNKKG